MELYELLFTLYKYERYYNHNNKIGLTKTPKKIDKLITKAEDILFDLFNDLYNEKDFKKIKTYNFKFMNEEDLERIFKEFECEKKEVIFKLFKDLNHNFNGKNIEFVFNNNDFINSFLIPKFINKVDKKNIQAQENIVEENIVEENIVEESVIDEFSVLNVNEYEENLESLGLTVFYHP